MKKDFDITDPGEYTLIYAFKVKDEYESSFPDYRGLLKVGCTTIDLPDSFDIFTTDESKKYELHCKLVESAEERINGYTQTVQFPFDCIYAELAVGRNDDGKLFSFDDHLVHEWLEVRGKNPKILYDKKHNGVEWFQTTLDEINDIVNSIKNGEAVHDKRAVKKIELREEQKNAVIFTKKVFAHDSTCLWDCKMRFGKTVTCLQLIKEMHYDRAIIITHRPVVKDGWRDDFYSIFGENSDYKFCAKNYDNDLSKLTNNSHNIVAFSSLQYLREKDNEGNYIHTNVFDIDWDLVVIDEAHEGTQTDLGSDVIEETVKSNSKKLLLSGTPYKLIGETKREHIFSWTYIDEQKMKEKFSEEFPYKYNPYACLPKMCIYTIDLKKVIKDANLEDGEFDFSSFFRVYKEGEEATIQNPELIGKFVNEDDIKNFIKLLHNEENDSNYPFSKQEYRDYFKHTFWCLPGVKEIHAFKELLMKDEWFKNYWIMSVAGDNLDAEEALKIVKNGIFFHDQTITLSCGRLTTGVTVPEWTAVFYLSGSFLTEPTTYFQTIFRVQSPCNTLNGKQKETCYVFDFAPDRALRMNAFACNIDTKNNDEQNLSYEETKKVILEHKKYCSIIAMTGSHFTEYDVSKMIDAITNIRAEKVYEDGFENKFLYRFSADKLTPEMYDKIMQIKRRISNSPKNNTPKIIPIAKNGMTNKDAKLETTIPVEDPKINKKVTKKITNNNYKECIKVLQAISIRLPLIIYGLNPNIEISIKQFANEDAIDQASWEEFMPPNLTRKDLLELSEFYDDKVLNAAGRKLLHDVREANECNIEERIIKLGEIFNKFRNPDKETVLTPWRVVNEHLYDTLGGYDFINEHHKVFKEDEVIEPDFKYPQQYKDIPNVTSNAFSWKKKLLDINAKTGLYGLYCAYSILINEKVNSTVTDDKLAYIKIINDNIYSLCKTKMAKKIVARTLTGDNLNINPHVLVVDDMINILKDRSDPDRVNIIAKQVLNPNNWKINKEGEMHFNAIVGNPPYATRDGKEEENDNGRQTPIYQYFFDLAKKLKPNYISLIFKANWITGGKGLTNFYNEFTKDKCIKTFYFFPNSTQIFPTVDIEGGLNYFLRKKDNDEKCEVHCENFHGTEISKLYLNEDDIFIPSKSLRKIYRKVITQIKDNVTSITSDSKPYGLRSDVIEKPKKYKYEDKDFSKEPFKNGYTLVLRSSKAWIIRYLKDDFKFKKENKNLNSYKVFITKAYGCDPIGKSAHTPVLRDKQILGFPGTCCTETFLEMGGFTKNEALNMIKYIKTKFFRVLVAIMKTTQNTTKDTYKYVPLLDLNSTIFEPNNYKIDWTKSISDIDMQLAETFKLDSDDVKFIDENIESIGSESSIDIVTNEATGSTISPLDESFEVIDEEDQVEPDE